MWTRFRDMHSGGGQKTGFDHIYVELPERQAVTWFKQYFNRNPYNTTCRTCGDDFSISEGESIQKLTSFQRNARVNDDGTEVPESTWGKYLTLEEYGDLDEAFIMSAFNLEDTVYDCYTYEDPYDMGSFESYPDNSYDSFDCNGVPC